VGRKPLLIAGGLISGFSMLALGSLFHAQLAAAYGFWAVCGFLAGFAISFGPIVWIMMTELFPPPIRGKAMAVAITSQWIANLLVSGTFPLLLGNGTLNAAFNHGFPFWLYGGFAILSVFVVMRYVPETRGVDSEQLSALWRREETARATDG
jgi:MFS transporter, SP family, xylose:H+ symportor